MPRAEPGAEGVPRRVAVGRQAALASNNPLQIEEAAKQSLALGDRVGPFTDWCGVLKSIEGNAQNVAVTIEIGPQVSLYAFNDWTLAMAGAVADLFSSRSREAPPPGLSDSAIAALKTFRLGERVKLAGRMGEIAGSGLFDLARLFGKSDADNRQFLQSPRFVARIESLAAAQQEIERTLEVPSFSYDFPYPTKKLPIFASNVVASSQPLAATAGLRMLAGRQRGRCGACDRDHADRGRAVHERHRRRCLRADLGTASCTG